MSTADASLVTRAKTGDPDAFADIFRHYRPRIHAYCYHILGNVADAEDLTQETFLRAYRALDQTADRLALSAWLYRIAGNACTDLLRRRQTARWLPWEEHYDQPVSHRDDLPEAALLDAEAQRLFGTICQAMSPRNRQALVLRAHYGYSIEQIGARLGLTIPAVKSLLFRARGEFRGLVEGMFAGGSGD
jgi:RNA polymerase sigma-70 factor (ECF subfamily)